MLQVNLRDYASKFLPQRHRYAKDFEVPFGANELANGMYLPPGILFLVVVAHIFLSYVVTVLLSHILRSRSSFSLLVMVALFVFTYREYLLGFL